MKKEREKDREREKERMNLEGRNGMWHLPSRILSSLFVSFRLDSQSPVLSLPSSLVYPFRIVLFMFKIFLLFLERRMTRQASTPRTSLREDSRETTSVFPSFISSACQIQKISRSGIHRFLLNCISFSLSVSLCFSHRSRELLRILQRGTALLLL